MSNSENIVDLMKECQLWKDRAFISESKLKELANISHAGGLIGYGDINDAMNQIRKLTLDYWDKA